MNFEWFPLLVSVKIGATCQQEEKAVKENHWVKEITASSRRGIMYKEGSTVSERLPVVDLQRPLHSQEALLGGKKYLQSLYCIILNNFSHWEGQKSM